ncbi:helix-turn-helix domain-containing protein [Companilactobacillus sp. HBUAS59699]|uniref:helix-turn-helix domain-containing protein n=1 Tax=Companilactobacillus sp. HBUAS59699 TaxID=3109358 RepID=UPI002FEFCB21
MLKLGTRIRELRKRDHLTQQQIGDFLGVKKASVSSYEGGSRLPDVNAIAKLAKYFNTTTDYLLGNTNDPSSNVNTANMNDLLASRLNSDYNDLNESDKREVQDFIEYIKNKTNNK